MKDKGEARRAPSRAGKPPGRAIEDERFAAAQFDPRFQRFPRAKNKVEIDDRFAGMFKDRAFQVRSAVDKRGRKVGKKQQKEDMRKYYRLENEEEDWGKKGAEDAEAEAEPPVAVEPDAPAAAEPKPSKVSKKKQAKVAKAAAGDSAAAARPQPGAAAAGKKQKQKRQPAPEPPAVPEEASEPDSESESEPEFATEAERRAAERWARVRGLAGPETSSESEDSSDEGSDDSEGGAGAEDVDLEEWGVGAMAGNPDEQVPEVEEETARLAVLDLDWTKVRAVDILAMLRSFLRKGQAIRRVTVYPSDYGLQRMAEEARFGPAGLVDAARIQAALQRGDGQQGAAEPPAEAPATGRRAGGKARGFSEAERAAILETLNEQDSDEESGGSEDSGDSKSSGSGEDSGSEEEEAAAADRAEEDASEDDEVSRRRLQLYERSRLRYYYAIVECADVATAAHLYRECDGMEFEHSASAFDLRYVPDAQDFSARQVRDEATAVPAGYVAPEVGIAPMLHTKPKLTWDADEDDRRKALSRRLTKEQLRDDDFKAYLGSESDEDEAQRDEAARSKYSELLAGGGPDARRAGGKDWAADGSDEEESGSDREPAGGARDRDMELQVTFGGGLDQLQQRLQSKREAALNQKTDTVWQAYLRRRREKRLEAKRLSRRADSDAESLSDGERGETDPFFRHDENAFDDPFFQDAEDGQDGAGTAADAAAEAPGGGARQAERKAKKQAAREAAQAERQRRAELELLLMDDGLLQDASRLGVRPRLQQQEEEAADERPKGKLSRKARLAAKRAAKAARKQAGSDDEDAPAPDGGAFKLDLGDSRFGELYTDPAFALDPTDPRYKDSQGTQTILREAGRRREAKAGAKPHAQQPAETPAEPREGNLKSLVASLKRKANRQPGAAPAAGRKGSKKARAS